MRDDTIYALASGRGRAGIAVLRVSGPAAGAALSALAPGLGGALPAPRYATLARLADPQTRELIDEAVVLWFPGPASFTGEDVAELHLHGGPAVVAGAVDALAKLGSLRLAEPGEFTRRAFEHGKLDLTAAEAVADLVAAETAGQRRQALRQMGGALAARYDGWRERLVRAMSHVEAEIDFADEELPGDLARAALREVAALEREVRAHLDDGGRGERLRDGIVVAILGAPNVGKSSLLNRLAKRDVAIVSEVAGTTRDALEVHLDLGGLPVTLVDTAGLRDSGDPIEREGVRRATARAADADLRLGVVEATAWPDGRFAIAELLQPGDVVVVNKADLRPLSPAKDDPRAVAVSARTGAGLDALLGALRARIGEADAGREEAPLTRARHRRALTDAADGLARAAGAAAAGAGWELVAEDLRIAATALGRLTGRVDVEEMLDVIFREFCIGK